MCQRIKVWRSRVYPLGQLPTIKVAGILYARNLQKKCQYFFCVKLFGKTSILGASKIWREFWAREFQFFCHKKASKPVIIEFEKSEEKKNLWTHCSKISDFPWFLSVISLSLPHPVILLLTTRHCYALIKRCY